MTPAVFLFQLPFDISFFLKFIICKVLRNRRSFETNIPVSDSFFETDIPDVVLRNRRTGF